MVTDLPRRRGLLLAAGALCPRWVHASASPGRVPLAAAWSTGEGQRHFAGLLMGDAASGTLTERARIELPTRAHGLLPLADGSLLVVARRPGDWLLRWYPATGRTRWAWADAGHVYTGHAALLPGGRQAVLGQTELEHGHGEIAVLDLASMCMLQRWPSRGRDPHALLLHAGRLWVANGGIETRPETGRHKRALAQMDSSLVALSPKNGWLLG
jgi:uncharacterized protein